MNWIKEHLAMITAVIVAGFALYRAAVQQNTARKWQETSVDIEAGNVVKGTLTAEAASTKAKLHEARAKEIKANAEKKVQNRDQSTSDVLAGWGVRDDTAL